MSKLICGIPVIYSEPAEFCEYCSKFKECRPYGPKGERICFDCAMKDKATTEKMMEKVLVGERPIQ